MLNYGISFRLVKFHFKTYVLKYTQRFVSFYSITTVVFLVFGTILLHVLILLLTDSGEHKRPWYEYVCLRAAALAWLSISCKYISWVHEMCQQRRRGRASWPGLCCYLLCFMRVAAKLWNELLIHQDELHFETA